MTLEQFIPGLKRRCSDCGEILPEGETRWLEKKGEKKPLCRNCFGRQLGRKG